MWIAKSKLLESIIAVRSSHTLQSNRHFDYLNLISSDMFAFSLHSRLSLLTDEDVLCNFRTCTRIDCVR